MSKKYDHAEYKLDGEKITICLNKSTIAIVDKASEDELTSIVLGLWFDPIGPFNERRKSETLEQGMRNGIDILPVMDRIEIENTCIQTGIACGFPCIGECDTVANKTAKLIKKPAPKAEEKLFTLSDLIRVERCYLRLGDFDIRYRGQIVQRIANEREAEQRRLEREAKK